MGRGIDDVFIPKFFFEGNLILQKFLILRLKIDRISIGYFRAQMFLFIWLSSLLILIVYSVSTMRWILLVLCFLMCLSSIAEIIILIGRHINLIRSFWGDQDYDQNDAVFQERKPKRITESIPLKLFSVFPKGDGLLLDRLITAFAQLIILSIDRQPKGRSQSMFLRLFPYFLYLLYDSLFSHWFYIRLNLEWKENSRVCLNFLIRVNLYLIL